MHELTSSENEYTLLNGLSVVYIDVRLHALSHLRCLLGPDNSTASPDFGSEFPQLRWSRTRCANSNTMNGFIATRLHDSDFRREPTMTMEQKGLLSEERDDDKDTESQQSGADSVCRPQVLKQSWLPAVLVLYSLVVTGFLIIPHLSIASRLRLPYCKLPRTRFNFAIAATKTKA